jgi:hypothetical protein
MPRFRKQGKGARNFINVAISKETRAGLHLLKEAMGVPGQAEVIEKLVTIGVAIRLAARESVAVRFSEGSCRGRSGPRKRPAEVAANASL